MIERKKRRTEGLDWGKMRGEGSDGVGQIEVQKGNILQNEEILF